MKQHTHIAIAASLAASAALASAVVTPPVVAADPGAEGPFKPTDASLASYQCPDWFRDAKFGIWAHWGPQAVPRQGDWYARGLYEHGTLKGEGEERNNQNRYNKYHIEHYGHPSKTGYKDIIPLWKAERWNPEQLMALYKKTGARYFVSMGTHHDNFFLWDSKIHRWNSVQMGPHKDVVGIWQKAAREQGLKFGVSEHLGASFTWFRTSHGADADGPMKGVSYDGNNPEFQDLYHKPRAAGDDQWLTKDPDDQRTWFNSIKELIDNYHPDLLYSDSGMPFGDVGRSMIARLYNDNAARNGGKVEAVYNCKEDAHGKWVRDIERGVADGIRPEPWQTDTSIGDWFYRTGQKYMTSGEVIRMLVDIVSKNGNLLLNVVQTPEGDLEPDVQGILKGIGSWVAINGEGVYGTRPWKVFGEGPAMAKQEKGRFGGLKDVPDKPFTAGDFRFTASKDGNTLYAFCFGVPDQEFRIVSLGKDGKLENREITSVSILGSTEKVSWKQEAGALVVGKPSGIPDKEAVGIRITFKP